MTIRDAQHTSRKGPSVEFHQNGLLAPTSCETVSTTFLSNAQYKTLDFPNTPASKQARIPI